MTCCLYRIRRLNFFIIALGLFFPLSSTTVRSVRVYHFVLVRKLKDRPKYPYEQVTVLSRQFFLFSRTLSRLPPHQSDGRRRWLASRRGALSCGSGGHGSGRGRRWRPKQERLWRQPPRRRVRIPALPRRRHVRSPAQPQWRRVRNFTWPKHTSKGATQRRSKV